MVTNLIWAHKTLFSRILNKVSRFQILSGMIVMYILMRQCGIHLMTIGSTYDMDIGH